MIERTEKITLRAVCDGCGARGFPCVGATQPDAVAELQAWRKRYAWSVDGTKDLCQACTAKKEVTA